MHSMCTRTLYAFYMHSICTPYALYMHSICTLYALYMHSTQARSTQVELGLERSAEDEPVVVSREHDPAGIASREHDPSISTL